MTLIIKLSTGWYELLISEWMVSESENMILESEDIMNFLFVSQYLPQLTMPQNPLTVVSLKFPFDPKEKR